MELFRLLRAVEHEMIQGSIKKRVGKVTNDSRNVEAGDVFVCIRGYQADGHDKIAEAAKKGAGAIVVDEAFVKCAWGDSENIQMQSLVGNENVSVIAVSDTRYGLAILSAAQYDYPAEKLKIIGITGTKGKSTVACMLHQILNSAGHKTGLIGTIQVDTGIQSYKTPNTTPESIELQRYLREMVDAGCEYAVMEVSSQGLKLQRVAGISFEIGIFTNIGVDHIGPTEHEDFEEYVACKKELFKRCKVGIGNIDDPYFKEMFEHATYEKITYGLKKPEADFYGHHIKKERTDHGLVIEFKYRTKEKDYTVFLPIPGEFNVYNSLAAVTALHYLNLTETQIRDGMRNVKILGRMEKIKDCMLYIDYAHNGMSLRSVLKTLRAYKPKRIIVVFGCGGDRDKGRRYDMGKAAGEGADFTIITTDNPRFESPAQIIKDIVKGIKKTEGRYKIIPDRREAIHYAIKNRREGDIILIAGKGHETYQEIKGIRYEMDDRRIVAECMQM